MSSITMVVDQVASRGVIDGRCKLDAEAFPAEIAPRTNKNNVRNDVDHADVFFLCVQTYAEMSMRRVDAISRC